MQKNFELMGLFQVVLVEVTLSEENGHLERDGLFSPQVLDLGTENHCSIFSYETDFIWEVVENSPS